MDIAAPVSEILKCASLPAIRHIRYLLFYKRYVNGLQVILQENLVRLENDVKGKVNLARNNGDVIHEIVENWIVKVETMKNEADTLSCLAGEIDSCFKGWSVRYGIGKESKKKIMVVGELLNEGRSFNAVSNPSPLPPSNIEHFVEFASRENTKKEVIGALMNDKTNLIGIYGMTGVGKTTMMKQISKNVIEMDIFDKVVMTTVSQNSDLKRIQTEIAENLGMKIHEESISLRAARLSERLRKEERILLILDDLWTRLELADVGIYPFGDCHSNCKVIITSRALDICNSMEAIVCIEVQAISKCDSLELFRQNAGVVHSDAFSTISEEIVNECAGLPLAVVILSRALRGKNEDIWGSVIPHLRKSKYSSTTVGKQVDPQHSIRVLTQTAQAMEAANNCMVKKGNELQRGMMKQAAIESQKKEANVKKAIAATAKYAAYVNAVAIDNLKDGNAPGLFGDGFIEVERNDTWEYDSSLSECDQQFIVVESFNSNGSSPSKFSKVSNNDCGADTGVKRIEENSDPASILPISGGEGTVPDCTNGFDKTSMGHEPTLTVRGDLGILNGVSLTSDSPSKYKGLTQLKYIPLENIDGYPTVSFQEEEFKESTEEFDSYLVGNFLGDGLEYRYVRDALIKLWNLKGSIEVTLMNNTIFFLKFSSSEERERVLKMDPQFIDNELFVVRAWRPFIETEEIELKTIPIWVNLKKVPVHLRNRHAIAKIASFIGTPLFLDKDTEDWTTASFPRVCIEVLSDRDLPSIVPVAYERNRRSNIEVEYNWIPRKCNKCQIFGHNSLKCLEDKKKVRQKNIVK